MLSISNSKATRLFEYFTTTFSESFSWAKSDIFWISIIDILGIIKEKSSHWIELLVLYSVSLNESVPTKTSFLCQSSSFDFIRTQVSTGLKFFSVTEYSTFAMPSESDWVSNVIVFSCGTSGKATYSFADIPFISKLSFLVLMIIVFVCGSVLISICSSSIVLIISENILAFIVIAHSNFMSQGVSISIYFSISVALTIRLSIDAFR